MKFDNENERLAHEVSLFLSAEDSLAALNGAHWKKEKVIFEKLFQSSLLNGEDEHIDMEV